MLYMNAADGTGTGSLKIEHLKKIGMDLPELLEIITPLQ